MNAGLVRNAYCFIFGPVFWFWFCFFVCFLFVCLWVGFFVFCWLLLWVGFFFVYVVLWDSRYLGFMTHLFLIYLCFYSRKAI